MQFIDAASVRSGLSFSRLIPALQSMFVSGCEVPKREIHTVASDAGSGMTVLIMPAWQRDRYFGIKTVTVAPDNSSLGMPGLFSTYVLHNARTGEPLAYIDANELTSRRTAAASALAASYLARRDSKCLLVMGAGRVGSLMPAAYREVLPIESVTIWDRTQRKAAALAAELSADGFSATVANDVSAAVAQADVITCATMATAPIIHGEWLQPGTHLDLIGSFTPTMREADDRCFLGASIYVDTEEALVKSGDLIGPLSRGIITRHDIRGTLSELCSKACAGRTTAEERTVFKSVGTALEDLAAAILLME